MKTEHIVLVGLIVLIVVFVMNQQKKELYIEKCGNKMKDQNYYFNETKNGNMCSNNCQCMGMRTCSKGWCTGKVK